MMYETRLNGERVAVSSVTIRFGAGVRLIARRIGP